MKQDRCATPPLSNKKVEMPLPGVILIWFTDHTRLQGVQQAFLENPAHGCERLL
jgi:hypothetical protein